jgi:hypothetical protein
MPFVQHDMQALIITSPDAAKKKILAAIKASHVHLGKAAEALGCSHATLVRWVGKLGLAESVAEMKADAIEHGKYAGHKGGRPPGSTIANGAKKPIERATGTR